MKRFLKLFITLIFTICVILPSCSLAQELPYSQANSISELQNIIFNAIKSRQTEFRVRYFGSTDNIMNDVRKARDAAVAQDPYDEGCISLISGFTLSKFADHADITFDSFAYYTTAEQEQYVNSNIQNIFSSIITINMSEGQKVKAIHDYIVTHYKYDNSLANYTAYNALHDGSTVCNGFVQLGYRLFRLANIESRVVKGTLISNGQNHTWNMVRVNNQWFHMDLTLDTISTSQNKISYTYYNLNDNDIKATHSFDQSLYPASTAKYQSNPVSIGALTDITISQGQVPQLPSKVLVTFEDSTTLEVPVIWENFDSLTPGTKVIKGTVAVGSYVVNTYLRVIVKDIPVSLPSDVSLVNKFSNLPQAPDKIWVLEFNTNIDPGTINSENIIVVDSENVKVSGVAVKRGSKDSQIVIEAPPGGYTRGKTYFIYILQGLKSTSMKNSIKPIKIPFLINN